MSTLDYPLSTNNTMTRDTPTAEEIVKIWLQKEKDSYAYVNYEYLEDVTLDGIFNIDKLVTTIASYSNARYEEGVKAERERIKDLITSKCED